MNEPLNDFDWKTQRSAIDPDVWHSKGLDDKTVLSIRRALVLADKVASLNENAGEIGEGMLRNLVSDARGVFNQDVQTN